MRYLILTWTGDEKELEPEDRNRWHLFGYGTDLDDIRTRTADLVRTFKKHHLPYLVKIVETTVLEAIES